MIYKVNFQTGAGNKSGFRKVERAKKYAEENCCYTQQNIVIENENGKEVARLPWWGVEPDEDEIITAKFGSFGYYGEWQDLE